MLTRRTFCFLLLLTLAAAAPATAQDVDRVRADSLRLAGDLAAAATAYQAVLSRDPADGEAAFLLASTYALQPHLMDQAFAHLHRALAFDSTMKPLWHADLFFLTDDARWAQVEATQLDKLAAQVAGPFDRAYAQELLRIRMREHAYRYHVMLAFRQLGPQSPMVPALSRSMGDNHAANLARLEQLIAEHGWPEHSRVGPEAAYAAGNVINHSSVETRQRYLPLLEAVCANGEGDWSRYAHILDRTELEQGRPQVYGTQMALNEAAQRYEPQPMVDPAHVDARRANKGMEPLEAQLRRFNASMQRDFGGQNR